MSSKRGVYSYAYTRPRGLFIQYLTFRLPKEKGHGIFTKKARLPRAAIAAAIPKESRNKDSVYG